MADNIMPAVLAMIRSKQAIVDVLGARIYPSVIPAGVKQFPAASYNVVSQSGNRTFDGASRYDFNNVDFEVYGPSKSAVDAVIETMRRELEDTKGTYEGVYISGVSYVDSGSDGWNDTMNKYSKQIEFKIDHKRSR